MALNFKPLMDSDVCTAPGIWGRRGTSIDLIRLAYMVQASNLLHLSCDFVAFVKIWSRLVASYHFI